MTRQRSTQTLPMKLSLLVVLTLGVRAAAGCAASSEDSDMAPSSDPDGGRTATLPGIVDEPAEPRGTERAGCAA